MAIRRYQEPDALRGVSAVKPGKVPGPVRIKPNKKSDLTDFRRAKRLQDYVNWQLTKGLPPEMVSVALFGDSDGRHGDR